MHKGWIIRAAVLALLLCVSAASYAAQVRVYFIGNSVSDAINYNGLKALAESRAHTMPWGRHMIPGAPLSWIWDHPNDGFSESPYGLYPNALPNYTWDAVSLQPYDRGLFGADGDVQMGSNFINRALQNSNNNNCQYFVYGRWPNTPQNSDGSPQYMDYQAEWTRTDTIDCRKFFQDLTNELRAAFPNLPKNVKMVPAGEVFFELDKRMKAGQISGFANIIDVYEDGVHLTNVGSYIVALTFYSTMYRDNCNGMIVPSNFAPRSGRARDRTIGSTLAAQLQDAVWDVVSTYSYAGIGTSEPPPPPPPPAAKSTDIPGGTATIDGAVDSVWGGAPSNTIGNTAGTVSSTSDCSGTFKALWDSSNLYVLAEVTDDNKSNDSTNPWEDDSVELYVDGGNNKTVGSYDSNDRQLIFGWNDTVVVEGGGRGTTGVTFAKADPTTTSYRIEAKVPWSTLGVTKSANSKIGIDVHITDDDAGGAREGKKMWSDTEDGAWGNPSLFGEGNLLGGSEPPSSSLPAGWTSTDIGSPSPAGSGAISDLSTGRQWSIRGGGADIWGTSDSFQFSHTDTSGDTTVVAKVESIDNTNGWAKGGVMIRDGLAANAMFAMVVVTPSNGVHLQWRSTTGGSAADAGTTGTAPKWVRIQRSGNSFTASWSDNGSTWNTVGTAQTIAMASATKSGLCVTSHANGTLCGVIYTNVNVTTGTTPQPPAAPTNLAATAGDGQVALSWSASSGASSYNVKRSTTSGSGYTTIASPTTTSYTNTGLTNGTTYYYVVSAVNSAGESGNSNQTSATPQAVSTGSLTREVWTGISGTSVSQIPLSTTPGSTGSVATFEAPTNVGDNYGQRVRGYLTPAQTGSYTFWIASDDDSELWLSTNDQPSSKVRIANIVGWTNSREWGKYASQKSAAISLTAGQRYYVEALMKEGGGGDNLAVGWAKPGQSTTAPSEVVPGSALSPWDGGSAPTDPASLFANAGFESDLTSWTNTGSSAITSDAASGSKAVITGTGQGGVQQEVAYTSGGTLNVNVRAKLSGSVSGWSGIGIDFLDSAGVEIGEVSSQVTATSYTAWSNASVAVPAGTARLRFWTWKPGTTGSLLVDDVVVNKN